MLVKLPLIFFLLFALPAEAGYFELGLSGNYRKIYLPSDTDNDAFDETESITASIAYYFLEMTAVQLSFTNGSSERFVPSSVADVRTTHSYTLAGMDLIFTFAERTEFFIPYIKIGIGYFLEKEVAYEFDDHISGPSIETIPLRNTLVPSAGVGFRTRLTNTIALKLGIEAWTSDALANDPKIDWAGKIGISWFF